jgi:hypothetical protein
MRRAGQWIDQQTRKPISQDDALTFDRWYFGYIPSYRWIGQWGEADDASCVVTLQGRGSNELNGAHWQPDWLFVGVQFAVATIVLLPFAWPRNPDNRAEPNAAADRRGIR